MSELKINSARPDYCARVGVGLASPEINEATIQERIFLSDDGYNDEMQYKLDNGMWLLFRWYCDPLFSVGEKITWTEEKSGIRIFYGDASAYLQETRPGSKCFECK